MLRFNTCGMKVVRYRRKALRTETKFHLNEGAGSAPSQLQLSCTLLDTSDAQRLPAKYMMAAAISFALESMDLTLGELPFDEVS